jgi:hypothetical protein
MRDGSEFYRLSFVLPDKLYAQLAPGRKGPCLHGTLLTVHGAGLVAVEGRPLQQVLAQAGRFLRAHRMGSIAADLLGPGDTAQIGVLTAGRTVTFRPLDREALVAAAPKQLGLPGIGDAA